MWTKICGFKNPDVAAIAAQAGANAIGINFYPKSIRATGVENARDIVSAVDGEAMCVGLFVNEPLGDLVTTVQQTGVEGIQLHGDEDANYVAELARELPQHFIIKAFAIDEVGLHMVSQFLQRCDSTGIYPWACLLDARVSGQRGGTGQVAPWSIIEDQYLEDWPGLILAGGLNASNVAAAVEQVEPWGLDIASGAEVERGVKDPDLIRHLLSITPGL
jgi:phosphoribosylanthranilate isomerase